MSITRINNNIYLPIDDCVEMPSPPSLYRFPSDYFTVTPVEPLSPTIPKEEEDLHLAVQNGDIDEVRNLLLNGVNIDAQVNGYTPLGLAVVKQKIEIIKLLVERGADIYLQVYLKKDDPSFNIHTYFEAIFPSSRDKLPDGWEELVKKTVGLGWGPLQELIDSEMDISFTPNIDLIDHGLRESVLELMENPLFAKAMYLSNQENPLSISFVDELSKVDGVAYANAYYKSRSHQICIYKDIPHEEIKESIIFELINSLQRKDFNMIFDMAKHGDLSREEFTLLCEFTEFKTDIMLEKMMDNPNIQRVEDFNFEKNWVYFNTHLTGEGYSYHPDAYRTEWDLSFSEVYLTKTLLRELEAKIKWISL